MEDNLQTQEIQHKIIVELQSNSYVPLSLCVISLVFFADLLIVIKQILLNRFCNNTGHDLLTVERLLFMLYTHHCDELTPIVLVLFNDPYMIDVVGHRLQFEMIALDPLVIECVMMGVLRKGLNPMDLFTMDEIFDSLALPPSIRCITKGSEVTKATVQRTIIEPQVPYYGIGVNKILQIESQPFETQQSGSDERTNAVTQAGSSFPDLEHPKPNERLIEFEIDGVSHRILINVDKTQAAKNTSQLTLKKPEQTQAGLKASEPSNGHAGSQMSFEFSQASDKTNMFFNNPKLANLRKPTLQEVCERIKKNSQQEVGVENHDEDSHSSPGSLGKRQKNGDPEKFGFMTAHKLVQRNAQLAEFDENPRFVNPSLIDFDGLPPMDPLNTFFDCDVVYSEDEDEKQKDISSPKQEQMENSWGKKEGVQRENQ